MSLVALGLSWGVTQVGTGLGWASHAGLKSQQVLRAVAPALAVATVGGLLCGFAALTENSLNEALATLAPLATLFVALVIAVAGSFWLWPRGLVPKSNLYRWLAVSLGGWGISLTTLVALGSLSSFFRDRSLGFITAVVLPVLLTVVQYWAVRRSQSL